MLTELGCCYERAGVLRSPPSTFGSCARWTSASASPMAALDAVSIIDREGHLLADAAKEPRHNNVGFRVQGTYRLCYGGRCAGRGVGGAAVRGAASASGRAAAAADVGCGGGRAGSWRDHGGGAGDGGASRHR